jgi:RNA-binding protein
MPLTPTRKRYLRGFAHDLKPVILVGQKGLTPAVLKELDGALEHHELVKVKLADDDRESRRTAIDAIAAAAGADLVQSIGRTATFYRHNPKRSQFTLPK